MSLHKTKRVPHRNTMFYDPKRILPININADNTVYVVCHPLAIRLIYLCDKSEIIVEYYKLTLFYLPTKKVLTSSPGGCRQTHLAACRFIPTSDFWYRKQYSHKYNLGRRATSSGYGD